MEHRGYEVAWCDEDRQEGNPETGELKRVEVVEDGR